LYEAKRNKVHSEGGVLKMIQVPKSMSVSTVSEIQRIEPRIEPTKATAEVKSSTPKATKQGFDFKDFWTRLKKVKNIEIYAAVVVIGIMVLIFFSSIGGSGGKSQSNNSNLTAVEANYVREMEQKLVSVLTQVRGAGRVDAMVTAVGSATLEIAYNIDEKTVTQSGTGGSSTTTTTVIKTPVLVNGKEALILMEVKPQLKGVVILASGASDPMVRLNLLMAVQALVADPTVNVEVLTRN